MVRTSSELCLNSQQVNKHDFFAEPNAEVIVDFDMRNNNSTTHALDNDTGKFKKGDIELTVIKANGEHIGEKQIEAERKSKTLLHKAIHVYSFTILPM